MLLKRIVFPYFAIALLSSAIVVSNTHASETVNAESTFKNLQNLVGKWSGEYKSGSAHQVSYRLSARGSAIVETWTMSKDSESLTIYTLDGNRLLATHYCPQGNQVRLLLSEVDNDNKFHFVFLDGSNLHDENGHHQNSFWIQLLDTGTFARSETYTSNKNDKEAREPLEGEAVVYQRAK